MTNVVSKWCKSYQNTRNSTETIRMLHPFYFASRANGRRTNDTDGIDNKQQQQQQLYFLTLNISHHLQIARLIEAGGVWTA